MAEEATDAVAALFHDLYTQLVGLGVVLTGETHVAEDLVQESFARLLRRWDRLRDPTAAPTYLRTTLVNLATSRVRRRIVRRGATPLLAHAADQADASERTALFDILRRLPPRQRACIALRFYEGMDVEGVAQTMGTSAGTVKSQTHKALRRLREALEE